MQKTKIATLACLLAGASVASWAQTGGGSEFTADWRAQSMTNDMGPSHTAGAQIKLSNVGSLSTLLIRAEDKAWRMKGQDHQGQSGSAAAYYTLAPQWIGVTQLQAAGSALFPKSTVVQGLLFKTGDQGKWLWGAELGQARFNDGSRLTTTKVGPTYYWAGTNPGFATYRYAQGSKTGNSGHTVDTEVSVSYTLKLGFNYHQSEGAYSVLIPGTSPVSASVNSHQTELRLTTDLSPKWRLQLRAGQTVVDDVKQSANVLRSTDWQIAITHRW